MNSLFYPAFDLLEMRELPIPKPGRNEVLLKVAACGVCGSELETFKTKNPRRMPPQVMGHEFCGMIVERGAGVSSDFEGQRFVSNSVVSCGRCPRCRRGDTHLCQERQIFGMHRAGAFAEYVAVPVNVLIPCPEELSPEAAAMAEPLANGVHCVNLTNHLPVEKALVIGAGPIGLMCQQALQAMRGVEVMVCDLSAGRLEIASRLGAVKVVSPKSEDVAALTQAWTDGEGVDLVIDAAGSAATKRLSLSALRAGGATVWIGLHSNRVELDTYDITLPEKQIFGTYAAKQEELALALDLMKSGKVDVDSWTEKVPLKSSIEAFYRMLNPGDSDLKAVLIP